MATLIFSALGTAIGGPFGGAIGSLIGSRVDSAIIGGPKREGPRLKELSITTSSYGTPIPRLFGRMRVAGSIVWATDLAEHREKHGGKGKPSVTTYSYSASFAVALASRPITGVGRIWADGNLLRGAAGDLKAAGSVRFHRGGHDQAPDPLIAAAEGADRCPAFRGLAYAVFEDLQLADFGNRIPALTFEVFADAIESEGGDLDLSLLVEGAAVPLPGLAGFSSEGAPIETLAMLDPVYPMDCDAGALLTIARERLQDAPIPLSEAAVATGEGDFGGGRGFARRRQPAPDDPPEILRYYDVDRDYQPGLQRAPGKTGPNGTPGGQPRSIDLPGALTASSARTLAEQAARRARWALETVSWRTATLDTAVAPGSVVTLPGEPGRWRVADWEWRETGIEMTLERLPPIGGGTAVAADPGRASLPPDLGFGATVLVAFELPWDGTGGGDTPALFAAVSAAGPGWAGAALFVDHGDGDLVPLGPSGRTRSVMGAAVDALAPANPLLVDRMSSVTVALVGSGLGLTDATPRQLAMGANRALLGAEIVQFARAVPLGGGHWRLEHLLRGRGGTEAAVTGHAAGERFVLLDDAPVSLDAALVGTATEAAVVAIGLGDVDPVTSGIVDRGITLKPLSPVHPRRDLAPDGTLTLGWTRRARGAWLWADGVDTPLHEEAEAYQIAYAAPAADERLWDVSAPTLALSAATLAALPPGGTFRVRQRGSHALSDPLPLGGLA